MIAEPSFLKRESQKCVHVMAVSMMTGFKEKILT